MFGMAERYSIFIISDYIIALRGDGFPLLGRYFQPMSSVTIYRKTE